MYAVIFTAQVSELDEDYQRSAMRLRELALNKYACKGMTSLSEGDMEITVSYWTSLEDIHAWKQDREHLYAQASGREKWYRDYNVKITQVLREYEFSNKA